MARAKLYYIPGVVWHLTQRCHNRDFLLKFSRDRKRWLYWLFRAKKRYCLSILNYTVTSNHIHLLVYNDGRQNAIPRSILLTASRTAQEYNQRKNRSGSFWEDNYHATIVESGEYLRQCLVYIDLNMVRAGKVKHPADWPFCGYNEIQRGRQRYRLIDTDLLMELLQIKNLEELKSSYKEWIESKLVSKNMEREGLWTENIAVGTKDFAEKMKAELDIKVYNKKIKELKGTFVLKEQANPYNLFSQGKTVI